MCGAKAKFAKCCKCFKVNEVSSDIPKEETNVRLIHLLYYINIEPIKSN